MSFRTVTAGLLSMALLAGTFFGLDIAFWHASLVMTSVANATFLVNLGNAAVGLVAWVVLRERPARIWLAALAIALIGAFMLSRGAANADGAALAGSSSERSICTHGQYGGAPSAS